MFTFDLARVAKHEYTIFRKCQKSVGTDICTALIGLHAFTGCDSVSAFAGKFKVSNCRERYNLFCAKKGDIDSSLLPPCLDCLHKHAFRSNYQKAIWRKSLEACPVISSPNGHGWIVSMSTEIPTIEVDWMNGLRAPSAVLELHRNLSHSLQA